MQTTTIFLILIAAIVALGLVLFQYYFKTKRRGKLMVLLSFLRFLGVFGLLVLLINPKFTKNEYRLEKANLIVLSDNSSSMQAFKNDVDAIRDKINSNTAISDRFKVKEYHFGASLEDFDSLSFKEKNTNIAKTITSLKDVYASTKTAVVLLTDGNQTIGEDYVHKGNTLRFPVYPVAVGDTTRYEDLRIGQVNVNAYAFLKNKYPVEAYISYEGMGNIKTTVTILVNGKQVYSENVSLSNIDNTKVINTSINASSIGVKSIQVNVTALKNERNTVNNQKKVAVEVIDEKTKVVIISDVMHPDIGALKKAIERNEQRSVSIKKSNVKIEELEDVDVFVLYSPGPNFQSIYQYIRKKKASLFTITGSKTDANFLNRAQKKFRLNGGYPVQETFSTLNPAFSKFDVSNFDFSDYPPLDNNANVAGINDTDVVLKMKVLGREIGPLLAVMGNELDKEAVLFGGNIWKWRMQSYRDDQNFENFDDFIAKLILYLSTNASKNRLNVAYKSIYQGSHEAKITVTYFDEAFVFDSKANISLKLNGTENGVSKEIPMLLKGNFYEVDLTDLPAGTYSFTVTVKDENRSQKGTFTILDFNVEQQFSATDYKKLQQLASTTQGALHFPTETDALLQNLMNDNQFLPTQKGTENVVSLIDFRILLGIIAAALSLEWFIRKYNGLT